MADPQLVDVVSKQIAGQAPKPWNNPGIYKIIVGYALDKGVPPQDIITTAGNGKPSDIAVTIRNFTDTRSRVIEEQRKQQAEIDTRAKAGLSLGEGQTPSRESTPESTIQSDITPKNQPPPQITGGMSQWLITNGILTNDEIANSDPQIVLAIAKDAGYFNQFGGGNGSGRVISPDEIARANAQNILNNFNPENDFIRLPGTNKALIRGTNTTVDISQPGNFKSVLDDKGMPTGYMVDTATGQTLNASGNKIAADTLQHNIENDKAQLLIQQQNANTQAQATRQTGEYQQGSLAETIRSNKAAEQRAADQLAAQKAETIAKLQADPGNFAQREFTIRGLTAPSEVAAQEQARIDVADPVKQKLLADQQKGAVLAAAWNAGMNTGDFTDYSRGGGTAAIPKFATGGMTTAPQMIVGDPQQGQPVGNPEVVSNPTQAPVSVTPLNGVTQPQTQPDDQSTESTEPNPAADTVMTISKIMAMIGKLIKPGDSTEVAKDIGMVLMGHMQKGAGSIKSASNSGMPDMPDGMPKFAYGTPNLRDIYGFSPTANEDIQQLPSISQLSNPDYRTTLSKDLTFNGGFGTQLPEARGINYGSYLQLREDPTSYGLISSLYRTGSRNLDSEAAIAKRFAPIGNAYRGTVRT